MACDMEYGKLARLVYFFSQRTPAEKKIYIYRKALAFIRIFMISYLWYWGSPYSIHIGSANNKEFRRAGSKTHPNFKSANENCQRFKCTMKNITRLAQQNRPESTTKAVVSQHIKIHACIVFAYPLWEPRSRTTAEQKRTPSWCLQAEYTLWL